MSTAGICSRCGRPIPAGSEGKRCPRCLLESSLARSLVQEVPASFQPPAFDRTRFGNYELLEEIGRGGMGVVYRARQVNLNRTVAVKLLLGGQFASPEFVRRFRVEAEAAAALHHPNIVAIHEFGEEQGRPYFSMDYVAGRNLAEIVRDRPLGANQAARYLRDIARAVQYAHEHGTLHRDLKPSNILIDTDDEPRITDFGLAKRIEAAGGGDHDGRSGAADSSGPASISDLTITGQMLGSPNYIPPEQAAGRRHEIGPRSDIYSLGAVLYNMMTGRPPFSGETLTAILRQVQETEPVAPRLLNPSVPRDLETICLKCLEKEPGRRYGSAQELAEELDRFLNGEPIRARPVGLLGRLSRWCKRSPKLATLAGVVAALGIAIVVGTPVAVLRIRQERDAAVRHAAEEEKQRGLADEALWRLEIQRTQDYFATDNAAGGLASLAFLLRQNPTNCAVAEWLLSELTYRSFALPTMPPLQHDDMVFFALFSPDGSRLLTVSRNNSAYLWDAKSGQALAPPLRHDPSLVRSGHYRGPTEPLFARFSPDSKRIVTASIDHTAQLWDSATGKPVTGPLPHPDSVTFAEFSPDGRLLATACSDGAARLWDTSDGHAVGKPLRHDKELSALEFSTNGQWLVTASDDTTAQVWEVHTGQRVGRPLRHEKSVRDATFSPDSKLVATISGDFTGRLWNARTGEPASPPLHHEGVVNTVQFSPDGCWLVTSSFDKTARIWDVLTGQQHGQPLQHKATVRCAWFSPEGYRVVTASEDGTARVWDLKTGKPITEPFRHRAAVWSAQFSPDGQRVVTASSDKTAQVWEVRPGQAVSWPRSFGLTLKSTSWSRDGRWVLAVTTGSAFLLNATNVEHRMFLRHRPGVRFGQFSPDGRRVVTASADKTARVWDAETGQPATKPLRHDGAVHCAQFSPDARWVVTASDDHTARVWDVQTGEPLYPPLIHDNVVYTAEFSPDGRWIVTACADKQARIWDARTGQPAASSLAHPDEVASASFSPDGRLVLTVSKDNAARVWDVRSGQPLSPPLQHDGLVNSARFSPDGQRVVTASADMTARVWEASTGRPVTDPLRHEGSVVVADFSPDGQRVLCASSDGTARAWDAQTGQPRSSSIKHPKGLRYARFSPDGHWIAAAGGNWTVYIWEFTPAPLPIPDWLPDLAEAVATEKLNAQRGFEFVSTRALQQLKERLAQSPVSDTYTTWAGWFLADRFDRRLSPSGHETLRLRARCCIFDSHWGNWESTRLGLWEALPYQPGDAYLISCLARMVVAQDASENPRFLAEADWLSRRAIALAPTGEPEAWWARAICLERAGDLDAAVQACDEAARLGRENMHIFRAKGRLLEKAGCIPEAFEAFTRAIELMEKTGWDPNFTSFFIRERAEFLERNGRLQEARQDKLRAKGIVPRDPQTPRNLIDLWSVYNAGLGQSWVAISVNWKTLSALPRGRQNLAGVEFDIRGIVQLSGSDLKVSWPEYPDKAEGIPVGQRCRKLHFLHAAEGEESYDTSIGAYVVRYADGQQQEIPIVYGKDLIACDLGPPQHRNPPIVAWEGQQAPTLPILRLFISTWDNPRPDIQIESIDFVS
ncbi:MAG: protein kinase, partial [Verrucomicrobia bacterium]|nr:protein kinase [Verrucomicrobiota bacterium]